MIALLCSTIVTVLSKQTPSISVDVLSLLNYSFILLSVCELQIIYHETEQSHLYFDVSVDNLVENLT